MPLGAGLGQNVGLLVFSMYLLYNFWCHITFRFQVVLWFFPWMWFTYFDLHVRDLILSWRSAISRLILRAKSLVTFYSKAKKCWAISWTYINETQKQVCRDIFVLRTLIFSPYYNTNHELYYVSNPWVTKSVFGSVTMSMESPACRTSTSRSISGFLFYYFFCLYKIIKTVI